ncbi:MAG: lipopolysaccharide biosynthesis protein [Polaromonas sp.]|nr:lipopolysaccharide biosynthesis protein [Polaromonas sp.]
MSLKRKLFGNGIANAAGIGWTAVLQLISVPILTSVWGAERYGIWLMLTTIPTYFALSDLGFATAATSDMTMSVAKGEHNAAISTFNSVWVLILAVSAASVAIASTLLWMPFVSDTALTWWPVANGKVLFYLVAYSAAVLASRIILAGFRCSGHYAFGTLAYDSLVFAEGMFVLGMAYMGYDFTECAIGFLLARLSLLVVMSLQLRRTVPWLTLGFSRANGTELRRLLGPALAAMAIPTALAVNIQGMLLITGIFVSTTAVAVLGPVRTASRIAIQLVGIVNRATMPEFSSALAQGDVNARSKLLRINILMVMLVLMPGAILFGLYGKYLVTFWTGGRINPSADFVELIAVAMFLQGLWYFGSNLLVSVNMHIVFSKKLVLVSLATIIIAIPLGNIFGLIGIAVAILAAEVASFILIISPFLGQSRAVLR